MRKKKVAAHPRRRRKSKWDDRDRPMDKRRWWIEVRGSLGWYRDNSSPLPRDEAVRWACDLFLELRKKIPIQLVPEVKQ